jgi:hypothetical protein
MRKEKAYKAAGIAVLHLTEEEILADLPACSARLRAFLAPALH